MKSAARIVAPVVIALVIGATVPDVCAAVADIPSGAPSRTISTLPVRSDAGLAAEWITTRLLFSKRVERRTSGWFVLPSQAGTSNPPEVVAPVATAATTIELFARGCRRGRAPPL